MASPTKTPRTARGKLVVRYGAEPADCADAVLPIEIVNERMRVTRRQLRLGTGSTYTLLPGEYQVRASLPSGEVVTRPAHVRAGITTEVSVVPRVRSPREELTWTYLLRRMDPVGRPGRPERVPQTFTLAAGRRTTPDAPAAPEVAGGVLEAAIDTAAPFVRAADVWLMARAEANRSAPWARVIAPGAASVEEGVGPNALTLIRLAIPPARGPQWCLSIRLPWLKGVRCNAMIPPPPPAGQDVRVVAHYVRPSADPDSLQLKLEVHAGSARAEMLLGYLATGAFATARLVGEAVSSQAEQMLAAKLGDPTGAAIAGYYLLKAGEVKRLHDWTINLADRFEWMPDSAVIRAWHLMRSGSKDHAEILRWLLEAERRGLPIFTEGLRLLVLGLDLFARRKGADEVAVAARDRVQRFADHADFRARSTTFLGRSPAEPGGVAQ